MDSYINKLEATHIKPFLNGYTINGRTAEPTGKYAGGNPIYRVTYNCSKGEEKKVIFEFYITIMSYNCDIVKDEVSFSVIQNEQVTEPFGWWDTTNAYTNVIGLASHLD